MKRRYKVLLGIAAALATLGLGYAYSVRPLPFDEAVWKAGEQAPFDSSAPRLRMADGLLASDVLKNKTKAEVLAMLGPPTETDKFRDYALVYWLGAERGFISIDSEWLVVNFDTTQKVSEVQMVRD